MLSPVFACAGRGYSSARPEPQSTEIPASRSSASAYFARVLAITSAGSHSLVVWNPGEVGGRAMDDVGDGWRDYLCLEVANVATDRVQLAPGTTHRLSQRVEVLALDGIEGSRTE